MLATAGSLLLQVFVPYHRYVHVLKWLTLALFAYVGALAVVKVPWGEALYGLFVPQPQWNASFVTMLVAILGTTISPSTMLSSKKARTRSRSLAIERS